jgi:hypothetical protein
MRPLFLVGHVLSWRKRYVQNYVFAFCACGWGQVLSTKLLVGKVCFYVFMLFENKPVDTLLLKLLGMRIDGLSYPTPIADKQRVNNLHQQEESKAHQRVIDDSPILTVPQITHAPPIMLTQNPTAKHVLKSTPRLHQGITCNNRPGILSATNVIKPMPPINVSNPQHTKGWPHRCASNTIAGHEQHVRPTPLVHSNELSHNTP